MQQQTNTGIHSIIDAGRGNNTSNQQYQTPKNVSYYPFVSNIFISNA